MNILFGKICRECGNLFDFEKCPYCIKIKKEGQHGRIRKNAH